MMVEMARQPPNLNNLMNEGIAFAIDRFRQRIPSPHGVRFIIRVHQGFLPFLVGDGCSKIRRTCRHWQQLSRIQSKPLLSANASSLSSMYWFHKITSKRRSHRFCQSTRWALTWERLGNTLECRRNQPLIWQACTPAQLSCQIPLPRSPWLWSVHQLRPWSFVAMTLTVAMGRLANSLQPCPSRTTSG